MEISSDTEILEAQRKHAITPITFADAATYFPRLSSRLFWWKLAAKCEQCGKVQEKSKMLRQVGHGWFCNEGEYRKFWSQRQ